MEAVNQLLEQAERLAQLMAQHGAIRLELNADETRLRLVRATTPAHTPAEEAMPPLFLSGYAAPASAPESDAAAAWQPPALLEVRSEFVGYCTLAPMEIGDAVERGQVLATVEVLGIANEVVAPLPGVLEGWAIESGQPVQYGQTIAYLRPLSEE